MFQTGDYIIYGTKGVCQVRDVGPIDFSGATKGKLYYTLTPCYMEGSTVYAPVEAKGIMMRPIMSRKEALALIDTIPETSELWIKDEKSRESVYRETIKGCDSHELIRIIKTIWGRRRSRMAEGKKITVADDKYFRMAEDNLYGELAYSLGLDRDAVKEFITERLQKVRQEA